MQTPGRWCVGQMAGKVAGEVWALSEERVSAASAGGPGEGQGGLPRALAACCFKGFLFLHTS